MESQQLDVFAMNTICLFVYFVGILRSHSLSKEPEILQTGSLTEFLDKIYNSNNL